MARYVVQVVAPDGGTLSLLVALSPSQLCAALRDKIRSRLPGLRLGLTAPDADVTLHLDAADGPILDTEDLLSDVLTNDKDVVYAVISGPIASAGSSTQIAPPAFNHGAGQADAGKAVRVRVITPELARSQPNVNAIPLLPENAVTLKSTLKELHIHVKRHLGLVVDDGYMHAAELYNFKCNCNFARQIDSHAALTEHGLGGGNAFNTLIVVCGNSKVVCIPVTDPTRASLEHALELHLPTEAAANKSSFIGGIQVPQTGAPGNVHYLKLPVVALCAPQRHSRDRGKQASDSSLRQWTVLDMHTSEMPIHVTAHNLDKTLAAIGLEDCMVNGVLNIYAVKRTTSESMQHLESVPRGKDAIYRLDLAWTHPLGQSERGLANFLCSLRMFASLTHAGSMEEPEQDAILHLLMLLTNFPPAVRAVHILMRGETPHASERAVILQCMYEVLKSIVQLRVVDFKPQRLLEGSRLLFGLVLEKAKHLKVSMHDQGGQLPYMGTFKVHELRNLTTMEAVADPVQTLSGLVDRGFFDAFKDKGLLQWTNGNTTSKATSFNRKLHRACILSGGVKSSVVAFDIDAVNTISRYADQGDITKVIAAAEYSDLQYLANLCSRNKLGVLHPSTLPSADPPVLTLDRVGFLAVYVGRQACGKAGQDINMFRPTSSVVEEAVDVSIITQLLIPILERRNADGTAVFEAFGDHTRQVKDPDEIVVLCVDASASMDDRCGFIDVEENEGEVDDDDDEDIGNATSDEFGDSEAEDPAFDRPALDELKEYMSSHESFDDFLAIVQTGTDDYHRHRNAERVLTILRNLSIQQIEDRTKALEKARRRGTTYHYRQKSAILEQELATLKNRNLRLQQYKDALVAFLLYRAENHVLDEPLTWTVGQDVPQIPKRSSLPTHSSPKFEIPAEFLCPISAELMEDPVITVDGFTYERRNIERWFQTHETSPCTNLVLESFDLRPNYALKGSIVGWIKGAEIVSKYPSGSGEITICFKSPLFTLTATLPSSITLDDLYEMAFRMSKGRYQAFVLNQRNTLLIPSTELAMPYVNTGDAVVVAPVESGASSTAHGENEDLCLVKVYRGYNNAVFSYWESKTTTKTLASIIFRYYRHIFRQNPWQDTRESCTVWTGMTHRGDSHYRGQTRNHWEQLFVYFTREHAVGQLVNEPVFAEENDQEQRSGFHHGLQPLVLKVYLTRPPAHPKQKHKTLTRIGVLKQMFDAYVNRLLAYGYQTHLGLVTFRSTASLTQEITHATENFRHQLNSIRASGDTALWDAIALSCDTLMQYSTKYPDAKLRIICISDGADTKSKQQVHDVALGLIRDRVVVDSFCLGDIDNLDLQALSYLTGGYKFQPDQMEHAMAICEMEPVLSSLERPDIVLPDAAKRFHGNALSQFGRAKFRVELDEVTRDTFPRRKEHPLLSEAFVELGHLRGFNMANRSDNSLRLARIHSEIRNSGAKVHPHYDVYICEPNFSMWKVVMQGPPGSTYADATFLLYLQMGEDYPAFPPQGRFVTPIYHPNINRHGRICHSIFDRNWTVDTTNKDVIDTVYSLLMVPEFSDPINTVVTLNFHWDEVQFKEEAQRHIEKHASKDRAQWKREITTGWA